MELKYLEIFCAVIELRSFSKAARALNLTQPTISVHIKALEEEFSTKLLDRLGRSIMPTQEGEILYRYAKDIMKLKESACLAMQRLKGTLSGSLSIGASTIPGEYILPRYLARFKAAYPDVFLHMTIKDSSGIQTSVLEGEVDVGVIGAAVRNRNLIARKFLEDELILVAPPSFSPTTLQKSDLQTIPLLARETGSGSRAATEEHLAKTGVKMQELNIIAELGSSQAVIQAIKSGMGLAFLSRISVAKEIERKELKAVTVKGMTITRSFHVITHRLRYNSPPCRTFIEFLLK